MHVTEDGSDDVPFGRAFLQELFKMRHGFFMTSADCRTNGRMSSQQQPVSNVLIHRRFSVEDVDRRTFDERFIYTFDTVFTAA